MKKPKKEYCVVFFEEDIKSGKLVKAREEYGFSSYKKAEDHAVKYTKKDMGYNVMTCWR